MLAPCPAVLHRPVLQQNWLCVPAAPEIIPAFAFLLSCASALLCPSVTCTHVGSIAPGPRGPPRCGVLFPGEMCRAEPGGAGGPPGPGRSPGRRSSCRRRAGLHLMSLRCMVGNYARCNENNKAGSIVVSKNTANAECLLGAFVCHLWVSALGLAGCCHTL